jgi:predicted ribosome quality control (RQC) complex YloA/Tae2 family protein
MPFDSSALKAITIELRELLTGGRITKIYQTNPLDLLLIIRSKGDNQQLLLSAHPSLHRVHLTQGPKGQALPPSNFCMVLRKHLEGGKIKNIEQLDFERILEITVETRDEIGECNTNKLFIEIMGKHSNIILVDQDGKIIDSIKHIGPSMSRVRTILPNHPYSSVPNFDRVNPLRCSREDFERLIMQQPNEDLKQSFISFFTGISPLLFQEIIYRSGLENNRVIKTLEASELNKLYEVFSSIFLEIANNVFECNLIYNQDLSLNDFAVYPLFHIPASQKQKMCNSNQVVDYFYNKKTLQDKLLNIKKELLKIIDVALKRNRQKQDKLLNELKSNANWEELRIMGELLYANLHMLRPGIDKVTLINFYDEKKNKMTIKLDPMKSPAENAQLYFKKYNKCRNSIKAGKEQLTLTSNEIAYLESLSTSIVNSENLEELEEIREEMIEQGLLRKHNLNGKKNVVSQPLKFISRDSFQILVGKNNRQNDLLTLKTAKSDDLWFHAKNIPGSHVLIKTEGRAVPDNTIEDAAILAAYYSKAKFSGKTPVDFTQKKFVRKPKGAKPGMVIYENQTTIYVNPNSPIRKKLKKETH